MEEVGLGLTGMFGMEEVSFGPTKITWNGGKEEVSLSLTGIAWNEGSQF
jgi:hypothetical protein